MQVKTLGQRIRHLRIKNKMTQKTLAEALYVSESTVSYWERDKTEPSIIFIVRLTALFQTSLNYLIIGNEKSTL
ncbi:MAG: helix-turn-helix domain-containing protein [Oscillospiraceae bacterium]|nr:helix-turn-helix domain-containing protein [Oscillospiraceae bacterium]